MLIFAVNLFTNEVLSYIANRFLGQFSNINVQRIKSCNSSYLTLT